MLSGNGDGSFHEAVRHEAGATPREIIAADFDGDGHEDLVVTNVPNEGPLGLSILLGHGDGTFAAPHFFPTGEWPGLASTDVDADGDMDLIITFEESVAIYTNIIIDPLQPGDANMDGIFDSTDLVLVFTAGEYEDGVPNNSTFVEGDWNGDGDFDSGDLVLAFQSGNYTAAATQRLKETESGSNAPERSSLTTLAVRLRSVPPA